jgi:hypothetical protein
MNDSLFFIFILLFFEIQRYMKIPDFQVRDMKKKLFYMRKNIRYPTFWNAPEPTDITISLQDIGINGKCEVRNLWTGETSTATDGTLPVSLRPHACALFTCKN